MGADDVSAIPAETFAEVLADALAKADPSKNVRELVIAESRRQDDLRNAESRHVREVAALRAEYTNDLRMAETARIDAIRAVDVGAVNRAAEVAATQALTLATQVATSAETLRTQVAAAATASTVALAAALEPVQKDIADLRRAQYEQQGQKAQVAESSTRSSTNIGLWIAIAAVIVSIIVGAMYIVVNSSRSTTSPQPTIECLSTGGKLSACP